MTRHAYIMLSKSTTLVSSLIYIITRKPYTHSSVSIDPTLMEMYSFCRIYPKWMLPAGFSKESLHQGFYLMHSDIPVRLYRVEISEEKYQMLDEVFKRMYEKRKKFKYDVWGGLFYFLKKQHRRYNYRYCSWFVSEVLGELDIIPIHKPYCLFEPIDFSDVKELELVYEGKVEDLRKYINECYNG